MLYRYRIEADNLSGWGGIKEVTAGWYPLPAGAKNWLTEAYGIQAFTIARVPVLPVVADWRCCKCSDGVHLPAG